MKYNYKAILKRFCFPEFKLVLGKKGINFIVLIFALFIGLLSIGIGKGSIEFLRKEMDNPYVKFIEVEIPWTHNDDNELDKKLESKKIQNEYKFSKTLNVYFVWADFKSTSGKAESTKVRGVESNDEFYNYLIAESDVFVTSKVRNYLFDRTNWGCIVTQEYLKSIGLEDTEESYLTYLKYTGNNTYREIKVPICGVVPYLPDKVDLIVSMQFLAALNNSYDDYNPFDTYFNESYGFKRFFSKTDKYKKDFNSLGFKSVPIETCFKGFLYEGPTNVEITFEDVFEVPYFDQYNYGDWSELLRDKLIIVSNEETKLNELNKYLEDDHKLSIDLRSIKNKEYFNIFDNVSRILSYTIIGLSIITIILFISNLIINHIKANAKNIGTLKAFGLSNRLINLMYGGISLFFVLSSTIIAIIISELVGYIIINGTLKNKFSYLNFELIPITDILMFMVVLPVAIIVLRLNYSLKGKTPGDMIYERI